MQPSDASRCLIAPAPTPSAVSCRLATTPYCRRASSATARARSCTSVGLSDRMAATSSTRARMAGPGARKCRGSSRSSAAFAVALARPRPILALADVQEQVGDEDHADDAGQAPTDPERDVARLRGREACHGGDEQHGGNRQAQLPPAAHAASPWRWREKPAMVLIWDAAGPSR